jgi:hypothetical protein
MKDARVELVEKTVEVRLTVPAKALLGAISGEEK